MKMFYEIGLKLFSTNLESLRVVEKLYCQKVFDYLELMAIPGTDDKTVSSWKNLHIPIIVHAPHSSYGFNLSDSKMRKPNKEVFVEVRRFSDTLSAKYIIVHPGLTGEVEETILQIEAMKDKRILVENMPFVSLMGTRCIGSSPDEIKKILDETGSGFCLDIAHAIKSAFSNGREYFSFIKGLMKLGPKIMHLCGVKTTECFDNHLNLNAGDLDIKNMFRLVKRSMGAVKITLETPERDYKKLIDFKNDAARLKKLIGA